MILLKLFKPSQLIAAIAKATGREIKFKTPEKEKPDVEISGKSVLLSQVHPEIVDLSHLERFC